MRKILMHKTLLAALIIALVFAYVACNVISICRYSNVYEDEKCDVAIVLGAATSDNGVSEVYKQRLNHAAVLYQKGYVAKIIVTGGMGAGNSFTDAYMARNYLEIVGIPSDAILEEDKSTITQENLENAKKIMDENGYKSALIVSDPLHMKRAMLLAGDTGMDAFSSPTQSSAYKSIKTKIPFVARETFFYIGYKWYKLFTMKVPDSGWASVQAKHAQMFRHWTGKPAGSPSVFSGKSGCGRMCSDNWHSHG